jgi:prolipoprotein diacylglyceryl transferase
MTPLFITWNPSPEMFSIGGFAIRWYGLLFAASFFFGYLIMQKIFKKEDIPIKVLDKLTIYMLIGTVLGARLGHCLFYEPDYYFAHPWEILNIRQGGLASHGAAIGILFSLWIFSRFQKRKYSWIVDRIVLVVALSGFFIRTGNLINSEIVGSPTNLPWAFIFQQVDLIPRHPTQIYELLAYLAVFVLLTWLFFKKNAGDKPFLLTGLFMVLVFGFRFFIEFFKDIQVDFEKSMTLNMGQWLSIPVIVIGIILIALSLKKTKN